METITEDNKIYLEISSIVNYFSTFQKATLSRSDYERFCVIGGLDSLRQLSTDIELGNFRIDSKLVRVKDLYNRLKDDLNIVNEKMISANNLNRQACYMGKKVLQLQYEEENEMSAEVYLGLALPNQVFSENKDLIDSVSFERSKNLQKKYGERK